MRHGVCALLVPEGLSDSLGKQEESNAEVAQGVEAHRHQKRAASEERPCESESRDEVVGCWIAVAKVQSGESRPAGENRHPLADKTDERYTERESVDALLRNWRP